MLASGSDRPASSVRTLQRGAARTAHALREPARVRDQRGCVRRRRRWRPVAGGMRTMPDEAVRAIDTREELINALIEAAELEHGLLIQYLFAAYSLKRRPSEGISVEQVEQVREWGGAILGVARQEMAHLGTVCNLLTAIGGSPRFGR